MKRGILLWPLLLLGMETTAVQLSTQGSGQVLIYPYYTVNNNLNTLYSVVNSTADYKAIKISFMESQHGRDVLSFNVYLSPHDVWTGVLGSFTSTIPGHVGEPSVAHYSTDTSCAPFLNKSGQEFLPFEIDQDAPNSSMQRAREGHLVIMEMGVFDPSGITAQAMDHGNVGIPASCSTITAAWSGVDNEWSQDAPLPSSGGLIGSMSIINVVEGMSWTDEAIAIERFWIGDGQHTSPGALEPNLSSGDHNAQFLTPNGELIITDWDSGFEAVSALLMSKEIINEYALDSFIFARTEWVVSYPTKRFHTDAELVSPFAKVWDGNQSCDAFKLDVWDRTTQWLTRPFGAQKCSPCPPIPPPEMCYATNVQEFSLSLVDQEIPTSVLGSQNRLAPFQFGANHVTESGWAKMEFLFAEQVMTANNGVQLYGLPATGFSILQFTNAAAAEGLLAQYGSLFKHKRHIEWQDQANGGGK